MVGSKAPGGQAVSAKFQKQEAQKQGLGSENAPGRTEGLDKQPGKAPAASDSGDANTGVEAGANQPGEKGIRSVPVSNEPEQGGSNMK